MTSTATADRPCVFLGSLATANRLAPAGQRSQAISAFFVACYTGLIIPVVGVGVATECSVARIPPASRPSSAQS